MSLLSSDELLDVLLYLDRLTIDSFSFASRKLSHSSAIVPLGLCLRIFEHLKLTCSYRARQRFERLRRTVRRLLQQDPRGSKRFFLRTKPTSDYLLVNYEVKHVDVLLARLLKILETSCVDLFVIESGPGCAIPTYFLDALHRNRFKTG